MQKLKTLLAALALGALLPASANAVLLTAVDAAAGNTVTDFSAAGLLSFDLDIANPSVPTAITYTVEAGDLGAPLVFNAIVRNLFGLGIDHAKIHLDGASFLLAGTVDRPFDGTQADVHAAGDTARIQFTPAEFFEFHVGDPLGIGGASTNWLIGLSGLDVGDTFSIRVALPAPATLGLLLGALVLCAAARRRAA